MVPRVSIGVLSAGLFVVGCSSGSPSTRAASDTTSRVGAAPVVLTASGCRPDQLHADPGLVRFVVTNQAAAAGSFVVLQGDRALGRVDGVAQGSTATLELQLREGAYRTTCQAGSAVGGGALLVGRTAGAPELGQAADLLAAAATYRGWLRDQVAQLRAATGSLGEAVASGDGALARSRFLTVRLLYSRVKVAAHNFDNAELPGVTDPDEVIDPPPGPSDGGLGRIATGLWGGEPADELRPVVSRLAADVASFALRVDSLHIDGVSVMAATSGQLGDIVPDQLSGRAEPASHLDLVDVQGVVEGSKAALRAFAGPLQRRDRDVEATATARVAAVQRLLDELRTPDGYPRTSSVPAAQLRRLAAAVDAAADACASAAPTLAQPVAR